MSVKYQHLNSYLKITPLSLAIALPAVRQRRDWTVAEVALQAGVSEKLWQAWEAGSQPVLEDLIGALHRLYWVRDVDIVRGTDPGPEGAADHQLWEIFHLDAQADDYLLEASTPEAVSAFKELDRATFGTNSAAEQLKMLGEAVAEPTDVKQEVPGRRSHS